MHFIRTSINVLRLVFRYPTWAYLISALIPVVTLNAGVFAQTPTVIRVDASSPFVEPGPAAYDGGTAKSPSGRVLGLNERYLTLDGKPWLPVMGEFHFSRYPRERWEEELLKMKAAGVNVVASYVLWIHHEEVKGEFDWSGQRDLRAFAELCSKHGLFMVVRIGPWDHAEARNGGLPDWILKQGPTRINDPAYIASVRAWYGQIGDQLRGLLWKDGGPVVGIQLENEYSARGPGAGAEHILKLKELAVASGLDVPYYFVTGWDGAVIPDRAVLPVYGGYPDAPWDGSIAKLPPSEMYAFRFEEHDPTTVVTKAALAASVKPPHVPFLTAEMGGGNEVTYHRRPIIEPDDISAMLPVMIGSGVNLYGTYMFQGGENPDGKLTTLQESQATGYPNDVPIKSYDFQAPLGEFGQERGSFRKLKVFQYFLNDFGPALAPMMVHAPAQTPSSPDDFKVLRVSLRSRGDQGFLFVNNNVRGYSMPARPATQFEIQLPNSKLVFPRMPVDIPTGAAFIWPIDLTVDGVIIRYSTAQPMARIQDASGLDTVIFSAVNGIPPEFAFDATTIGSLEPACGQRSSESGIVYLSGIRASASCSIDVVSANGSKVRIVVLTEEEAENAWKARIGGADRLLISKQEFFADDGHIWLRSLDSPRFDFSVVPALEEPLSASLRIEPSQSSGRVSSFSALAPAKSPGLAVRLEQRPGNAPPVKMGPKAEWRRNSVAQAPSEGPLPSAGLWSLHIPASAFDGLSDVFLEVKYEGDVARLYSGSTLLDDDFYNGNPWSIGLSRFVRRETDATFDLSVLPLRKDSRIYLEVPVPPHDELREQVCAIKSLRLIPEYQLVIDEASH